MDPAHPRMNPESKQFLITVLIACVFNTPIQHHFSLRLLDQ